MYNSTEIREKNNIHVRIFTLNFFPRGHGVHKVKRGRERVI